MHKWIALAGLAIVLMTVNSSILSKEEHLAEGQIVYLELAPVDPRSLMQGDYMALRFDLADEIYAELPKIPNDARFRRNVAASDGHVVVNLDERGVGRFARLQSGFFDPTENEVQLRYRVRAGTVKLATNAFFFQEGHAELYEPAQFGQFRVDEDGELLLTAMYDKDLKRLGPD